MKLRDKLKSSLISRALQTIDHKDRVKLFWIAIIQTSLGVLDLLGVTFIGALGALSIQGIESKKAGNHVSVLLRILHVENLSFQMQVVWLGIAAAVAMVSKTLLSIFFTRKTFRFMSNRGAKMTADLVAKVLSQQMLDIQKRSSQETLFTVTSGVQSIMNGVIATSVNLLSDFSMLVILSIGLFFVDPITALSTILIFGIIGFYLHRLLNIKAQEVSKAISTQTLSTNSKILEVLRSYRENVVRGRRPFYVQEIGKIQQTLGKYIAENSFFPFVSKYVMDSATVVASLILGAIVLSLNNAVHGVATLTVFLAASTRIAPAALRIQQGIISIRTAQAPSELTITLNKEFSSIKLDEFNSDVFDFNHPNFEPSVHLKNVSFEYQNEAEFALQDVNLEIEPGQSVAIVGSSGAGKTTLIDLILGVLEPATGEILISGKKSSEVVKSLPGSIAYVPQDVTIISGTVRENVAMGFPKKMMSDELISWPLEIAQLKESTQNLENSFDYNVGESGAKLSGGQRQRLGIARALFTRPKLLVLDEATSALDGQTESDLTEAIKSLHGEVTVIIVAHRLSTVRNVDKVIYMEKGRIEAIGTFDQVRSQVPNFDKQANLMGIKMESLENNY